MVPIVDAIVRAYNSTVQFAHGIIQSLDEKKFAEAVNEMYGQVPSVSEWDKAVELIEKADDIGTEKKIELLKLAADERDRQKAAEIERKTAIGAAIDEHNREKGKVAVDIVAGILTGGVSLIPKAVQQVSGRKNAELPEGTVIREADIEEPAAEGQPEDEPAE